MFAVKAKKKYYMVSVNVRGKGIHVLDPLSTTEELSRKFGKGPEILVGILSLFFYLIGY